MIEVRVKTKTIDIASLTNGRVIWQSELEYALNSFSKTVPRHPMKELGMVR
jgi:hypothetical protein